MKTSIMTERMRYSLSEIAGLIAGVVAAGAIDIGYLSVAERPTTFSPSVIVSHGAMTLGVARAF